MSFILSIIFYWIQQGKFAILILSIKKNIPSGPYYLVMLPTMHRDELDELFSVRGLGPEAFTGMALESLPRFGLENPVFRTASH